MTGSVILLVVSVTGLGFVVWQAVGNRPRHGAAVRRTPPRLTPAASTEVTDWLRWLVVRLQQEETGMVQPRDVHEQRVLLVRLAGVVLTAVGRHRSDGDGRCRACQPRPTGWLRFLPRLSRTRPCVVQSSAELFLRRGVDVAWWLSLNQAGEYNTLTDVRRWLMGNRTSREPAEWHHSPS